MLLKLLPVLFVLLLISLIFYSPINIREQSSQQTSTLPDPDSGCCKIADILSASGDFDYLADQAIFNNQAADYPKQQLADAFNNQANQETAVLGTTNAAGEEKWIEIILAEQKLKAWEGNRVVKEFLVSTGLTGETPKGTFSIWYKTRNQVMSGGSRENGTYYYLPNVPNNMYFYGSYAIHGAYWHNNFGHPMSHGCVNEPLAEAQWMFNWAGPVNPPGVNALRATPDNPGTRVWIH